MHIGFDGKRFFHNTTGLGNYARSTVLGLARHCPGHRYTLYAARAATADCTTPAAAGITVHEACPLGQAVPTLWRSLGLPRSARPDRLDVYHGLSHELPLTPFARSTATVVSMHDLLFITHPHLYPRPDRIIYALKYKASCRRADLVAAVSAKTAADVIEVFGIAADRVHVAYQSCDPAFARRVGEIDRDHLRQRYGLPKEYMLFVGSLIARKGVRTLIHALALLPAADRRPLLVAGSGPLESALRSEAETLGVGKLVRFLGRVPQQDLPGIYQLATVFIYPSEAEGFGIPILEGLCSQVPVITSTGSCFHEPGGNAALYTTPGDAEELSATMLRVLSDAALRQNMVRRGILHARQFDLATTSRRLMDLYTQLHP